MNFRISPFFGIKFEIQHRSLSAYYEYYTQEELKEIMPTIELILKISQFNIKQLKIEIRYLIAKELLLGLVLLAFAISSTYFHFFPCIKNFQKSFREG